MNEDAVLTAIGGIQANIENQTKILDKLAIGQDEQGKRINELTTSIEIYKGHSNICAREFSTINEKLGRDYVAIAELKKIKTSNEAIDTYKEKRSKKFSWFIGILATIVSLLIGINQLASIKSKLVSSSASSSYAATLDSCKSDTVFKK